MRNHNLILVHDQANAFFDAQIKPALAEIYGSPEQLAADLRHAEQTRDNQRSMYFKARCQLCVRAAVMASLATMVVDTSFDPLAIDRLADAMQDYRDACREMLESAEAIALSDIEINRARLAMEGRQ